MQDLLFTRVKSSSLPHTKFSDGLHHVAVAPRGDISWPTNLRGFLNPILRIKRCVAYEIYVNQHSRNSGTRLAIAVYNFPFEGGYVRTTSNHVYRFLSAR